MIAAKVVKVKPGYDVQGYSVEICGYGTNFMDTKFTAEGRAEEINRRINATFAAEIEKERERYCRAICSYCRTGMTAIKSNKNPFVWGHYFAASGTEEDCDASAIRSLGSTEKDVKP